MSFLFGQTKAVKPAVGVSIQTSVYGIPIPIVYGRTKVSGNMILYGNFQAVSNSQGGGGKGSLVGSGGGKTGGASGQFTYYAAFAFALCEGPIVGTYAIWKSLAPYTAAQLGFSLNTGTYPQSPWGIALTWEVVDQVGIVYSGATQPLGYNGIAYVYTPTFNLGTSATLPNLQYEILGVYYQSSIWTDDADPAHVINDFLTNAHYGLGIPAAVLDFSGSWQTYIAYCRAAGLAISPAYTTQRTGSDMIDEIMTATNSACFFSSGLLQIVSYGDQALNAHGATFTPPTTPIYSLTDDDFVRSPQNNVGASATAGTSGPILMTRKRKSDTINSIKIECLDRTHNYNPAIVYANNQAEIDKYGLRTNGQRALHLFADVNMANRSAQLQLRRQMVVNTYRFDLDQRYILLDPMDIIAITDTALGLNQQLVRITEITENDDQTLSFLCEEYLHSGSTPEYTFAVGQGQPLVNLEALPDTMNQPIFFEPPLAMTNDMLEVWIAVSGSSANWGGCDVYISTDGVNYQLQGTIQGDCRMGVLTAPLASVTLAASGLTIDQTNTLSVDLSESQGALTTASQNEAQKLSTLCFCDGELIAYATATLTGTNKYDLTYLIRGAYGTPIGAHSAGSLFARMDIGIFKLEYTSDRIGSLIYVKFLSFNQFGGGKQSLAQAPAFTYTVNGSALTTTVANVLNLVLTFIADIAELSWDEITDLRPIQYEIRRGSSWAGGQFIIRQAHPPFRVQGDGIYWIAAVAVSGNVAVYSPIPSSISVVGSEVPTNIIASHEEDPGWIGTISGNLTKSGTTLITTGPGGGTYQIPVADRVLITYPFACKVIMKWTSASTPATNSVFAYFGSASLVAGSTVIGGLLTFSGTARLQGNTTLTNISNTSQMGAGQPITGIGITTGTLVANVLSTSSIQMTLPATLGSTLTSSTQTISVHPDLLPGLVLESTSTTFIPKNALITAISTDPSKCSISTTALVTASHTIEISISFIASTDLFGAQSAGNAFVYPQIRLSQDGGGTWSSIPELEGWIISGKWIRCANASHFQFDGNYRHSRNMEFLGRRS